MELASATGAPSSSSVQSQSTPSTPYVDGGGGSPSGSQTDGLANSPLALPSADHAADMEIPELTLDKAVDEVDREGKKSQ